MLNRADTPDVVADLRAPAKERVEQSERPLARPNQPSAISHNGDEPGYVYHAADRGHFDKPNPEPPVPAEQSIKPDIHLGEFFFALTRYFDTLNFFPAFIQVPVKSAEVFIDGQTNRHDSLVQKQHPNHVDSDDARHNRARHRTQNP